MRRAVSACVPLGGLSLIGRHLRIPFMWESGKDIDGTDFANPQFRFYESPKVCRLKSRRLYAHSQSGR